MVAPFVYKQFKFLSFLKMVFVFDLNLNLSFYDHRISSSHFFSILYYTFFRWSILIILPLNMTTYVKNILCFDDIVYNITLKRDLISWIIRSTVWNMYCIVLYKVKVFIEHGLNKFSFTTSKGEWWLLVDHNSKCTQNKETHIFNSSIPTKSYKTIKDKI